MVPLQAVCVCQHGSLLSRLVWRHTEFLLDNLENLLLIKLLGQALDSCQSLATISLLNANVDVILGFLRTPSIVVGLREGV
jgi:hypothetical protein